MLPRPFGEGWGEGLRCWMCFLWFDGWLTLRAPAGRDARPAAHLLFFASPKKSRQKKGDPTGRVPSLRCGQPAMLAPGAVLRNSLRSLRSLRSNSRSKSVHEAWACCAAHARPTPCASRHGQRGVEPQHGPSLRSAPGLAVGGAERSDGPNGFSTPWRLRLRRGAFGVARAAQHACASSTGSRGVFERRERSERSEFHRAPRKRCDAGLPRSEAQGSQTWGRFLLPPFLVRTRKGGALPGAHPGQPMHAEPAAAKAAGTEPTPAAHHPHPLPKGAREQDRSTARWGATQTPGRPSPPPSHQRGEGARQGRGRKAGEVA